MGEALCVILALHLILFHLIAPLNQYGCFHSYLMEVARHSHWRLWILLWSHIYHILCYKIIGSCQWKTLWVWLWHYHIHGKVITLFKVAWRPHTNFQPHHFLAVITTSSRYGKWPNHPFRKVIIFSRSHGDQMPSVCRIVSDNWKISCGCGYEKLTPFLPLHLFIILSACLKSTYQISAWLVL